jgi:ubiquinone/menaquinone biosynthesis C-methylase UbiE
MGKNLPLSPHCEDLEKFETISHRKINEEVASFFKFSNEKNVLTREIVRIIEPKKSYSVLDIGCGEGYVLRQIHKKVKHCTALDPDKKMLETLKKHLGGKPNIFFVNKRLEDFEITEKFDVTLSSHTLSFFNNKQQAINKMLDCTRKDGRLILVLHCYASEQLQMLREMFWMIKGREINHIYAEVLEGYFSERGFDPKLEKVETTAKFRSLETLLKSCYFFCRTDCNRIHDQTKQLICDYLGRKKINHYYEIKTLHGIISVVNS